MKLKRLLLIIPFALIVPAVKVLPAETYTNRLIHEKSPYLLQHAHNPVDWYPWGEEAFKKARAEDKPIFLSVGYSTCHWCHVMEGESYSNPEIAKIMNENFVPIKVDREERPDVDNVYMQAVMAMTGSGGWPMNVFLTPDLKPFYGGTYFPPEDRWGTPGLTTVLKEIADKWKSDRDSILRSSQELTQAIQAKAQGKSNATHSLDEKTLKKGYEQFSSSFDSKYGGFGSGMKFPRSHSVSFLLRYWKKIKDTKALGMVEKTLQEMARGGVYDHIGGGFHRYSTDPQWRVPHFEKMLYDQAILARTYLEAYQATGKEEYAKVAREIFDYVLRDMTDSGGAFYSAEDADSLDPDSFKKREGAFYLWSKEEIVENLGKENADIFSYAFGVQSGGNAPQDPQGEFKNKNILYLAHDLKETAQKFRRTPVEIESILKNSKAKLFTIRSKRPRPSLDDKVLTDWNGLMISSLAFGSRVLDEPRYRDAAQKAADFIIRNMKRSDSRLMHRFRSKDVTITGFIDDYAFFSEGLLDLYEATFDPRYLEEAKSLSGEMHELFWDDSGDGFFFTGKDGEELISRTKEFYDGAVPSGNSVAALVLLRLGRLTMDNQFETWARQALDAFSSQISQVPAEYPQMLIALDFAIGPSREIVIAGNEDDPTVQAMIHAIYSPFIPNKVVVLHPEVTEITKKIEALSPFVKNQNAINGKPTAYVCKNYVCNLPTTEVTKLKELLGDAAPWEKIIGTQAEEWTVSDWINSKPLTLKQLHGKVILVRFWTGPSCPYCRASASSLNEFYRKYHDRGLEIVGFYHHKSPEPLSKNVVKKLTQEFGFKFPVAIDRDWRTLKQWWLDKVETDWTSVSFLIDREGIVRHIHPGGQYVKGDEDYSRLDEMIQRYL